MEQEYEDFLCSKAVLLPLRRTWLFALLVDYQACMLIKGLISCSAGDVIGCSGQGYPVTNNGSHQKAVFDVFSESSL